MAPFPSKLKDLCTPAVLYFVASMIGLIAVVFQNVGNKNVYNLANFKARVPNTMLVFLVKFIYILFWTWILNLICKDGHTGIAWFLVLVPFILLFVIMGLLMVSN
jgi:H+/Cl- antiporter ClcA